MIMSFIGEISIILLFLALNAGAGLVHFILRNVEKFHLRFIMIHLSHQSIQSLIFILQSIGALGVGWSLGQNIR